jgi:hypothetical protein
MKRKQKEGRRIGIKGGKKRRREGKGGKEGRKEGEKGKKRSGVN